MSADTDVTARFHKGNPESSKAWEQAKHSAPRMRSLILEYVKSQGPTGATTDEILAAYPSWPHQSVSARMADLTRDGLLVNTDRTRLTRRNYAARVRVVATEGGPR